MTASPRHRRGQSRFSLFPKYIIHDSPTKKNSFGVDLNPMGDFFSGGLETLKKFEVPVMRRSFDGLLSRVQMMVQKSEAVSEKTETASARGLGRATRPSVPRR